MQICEYSTIAAPSQPCPCGPAAITFALELGFFFTALHHTSVANATTIGSLQTIALMAVASVRFGERIGGWLIGIALVAIGGVTVVMFGGGANGELQLRGDLLALAAMVLFTAYFVVVKDVRARIDTFTLQTITMALGAVVLLPLAAIEAGGLVPAWPSWTEWGWLALLPGFEPACLSQTKIPRKSRASDTGKTPTPSSLHVTLGGRFAVPVADKTNLSLILLKYLSLI